MIWFIFFNFCQTRPIFVRNRFLFLKILQKLHRMIFMIIWITPKVKILGNFEIYHFLPKIAFLAKIHWKTTGPYFRTDSKLQCFANFSKNYPFQHVERASKWYQIQKIACGDISLRFYRDMTWKWSKMFLNHSTYILHVCGYHLEAVLMLRSCASDSYGGPIVFLQTLFLVPYLESGL